MQRLLTRNNFIQKLAKNSVKINSLSLNQPHCQCLLLSQQNLSLFRFSKAMNVEIKMDKHGNIDEVINTEGRKQGDYKRYQYQDHDLDFQFEDHKTAKQIRQEKKRQKRINKKRRTEVGEESVGSPSQDIVLDINEQGDYRLRTKNMKKIMNQKVRPPRKDGIKEAKIIPDLSSLSSDEEASNSEPKATLK